MSLPPLVCNTPPPPDQCEEDNDLEDFDINYSLSQDDEEDCNGYNYQTYSNYNMYEETKSEPDQESNWSLRVNNDLDKTSPEKVEEVYKETDNMTPIINALSVKLSLDDVAVEDLNLEITPEQLNPQIPNTEKNDTDRSDNDYSLKEIEETIDKQSQENDFVEIDTVSTDNANAHSTSENAADNQHELNTDNLEQTTKSFEVPDEFDDFHSNLNFENSEVEIKVQPVIGVTYNEKEIELKSNTENVDDFGDFDDFKYINSNNITTIVENFENPWVSESSQTTDFGDFKANFEDCNTHVDNKSEVVNVEKVNSSDNEVSNDLEDDFGDFDDFRSCAKHSEESEQNVEIQQVPVLDFYSPDDENQILDSINKIFTSVFEEEISDTEEIFVGKIESVLNETWGHLVDTDVRQPYMLNWNNSLGQKSLLKALCIDSRNILFGPKWNYSMPKYAVNLCAAPLQPQKQLASTSPQKDTQIVDKSSSKEMDTWTDPFSSNGQESCNNGKNTSGAERRASDPEKFENVASPKQDKLYPTSLNVQPLRQINLPDTHIFTPTDSEIPRSKTIHYDNPVILSQVGSNDKTKSLSESPVNKAEDKLEDENGYWDFQGFKGASETTQSTEIKVNVKLDQTTEVADSKSLNVCNPHQPQLLQPIKVEPVMPTLNWPDPGQVKETFDDFSDFVSSAPWESDKNNVSTADTPNQALEVNATILDKNNDTISLKTNTNVESYDDDFEIFQSAPAVPQTTSIRAKETTNSELTYQPSTSKTVIFNAISEFDKFNTHETKTKSNDVFKKCNTHTSPDSHNSMSSVRDDLVTNSPVHSTDMPSMLKPLPANSSNTMSKLKNNTGQILQPLSLEGYSQINWPNPGIDLQDLSRFNPVETLPSLKSDINTSNQSKVNSPAHNEKSPVRNEELDDDIWGDFVSSKPRQQIASTKKPPVFGDEDEWTEFVSSPSVKPQNGLNTISLNVHTNLNMQKTSANKLNTKNNQITLDIPTLNYITPKSSSRTYNDKHFQNL
ncbi:uncharacterized protein Afti isoform X2 [Battus philenor]|uniref:uncharacterized protein Afti isoform X2 n=1 Tax=Battus philenor TaxID=42288 RepID=UPI0035D0DBE7